METPFDREKHDRLERFVNENRASFDEDEPRGDLWDRIDARLSRPAPPAESATPGEKAPFRRSRWERQLTYDWRVAAGILTITFLGILAYVNKEYGFARDPGMAIQRPAYAKEVSYYTQIISEKREELKKLTMQKPDLYSEFSSELDRLEQAYSGLRSELPESPDPETHLHAMVQNLQWQIDLLNQQLIIIEKIKKANENTDSNGHLMAM